MQFEPFFIPREPVAQCQAQLTELGRLGIELFHDNPGQGLAFLVAVGAMRDYPVAINGLPYEERQSSPLRSDLQGSLVAPLFALISSLLASVCVLCLHVCFARGCGVRGCGWM